MSELRNEIEEEFLGKVPGIDIRTTTKLKSLKPYPITTLAELKEHGWKYVAKVSNIGEKKLISLYSHVGVDVTEDEIKEYKKEVELERTSPSSSPDSITSISPSSSGITEADMPDITKAVSPDITATTESAKMEAGHGVKVTTNKGAGIFLKFEITSDLEDFILTLSKEPAEFLKRVQSTILNTSDEIVPTGARAHVKLWINLLEKKVTGRRLSYSIQTMNTPEKFRDVLIPLLSNTITSVEDELANNNISIAVNKIIASRESSTPAHINPESIVNTIILYKIYIDAAGSNWDETPMEGQLGVVDGKEFFRRMKDSLSGGSPDFEEWTIKRAWSSFQAGHAVLLAGMPGSGKTYFAKAFGQTMTDKVWDTLPFTRINITGGLEPQDILGEWDYQAQILALTVAKLRIGDKKNLTKQEIETLRENIYTVDYFRFGPLALAMIQGVPILIDEVNRGSPDIQNTLLQAIDENEVVIPSIGRIKASPGFCVICTINEQDVGTTELGQAFLRRVNYASFDEPKDYTKWVRQEFPGINETLLSQMNKVRLAIKSKATVTGEIPPSSFSAWARELINMYGLSATLNRERIVTTLGTMLKNKADIDDVKKNMDAIIREAGILS